MIKPRTRVAQILLDALTTEGKNVAWLKDELDCSYEHMRKVCGGVAFPSRRLLRDICRVLKLDYIDMQRLVLSEQIEAKYGNVVAKRVLGKDARALEFVNLFKQLSEKQQETVLGTVKIMARQGGANWTKRRVA